jgi:hypothetical protein
MHGIKYFFSIKIIRQFRGGKKNFQGGHVPKTLPKNTIFQNPGGARTTGSATGCNWTMGSGMCQSVPYFVISLFSADILDVGSFAWLKVIC